MATPLSDMNDEGGRKRLSVERIYQRKTQLEHILDRPDMYIGSVEETTQTMWVYDEEKEAIIQRQITYVPGLYKIFDEILVNAADNKQRDPKMNSIKVTIDQENNIISIWNNGKGIPIEIHKVEKLYVPELIFGTLLTSSNYDDDQKKVTGGRNGYGAKLCNIFSTEFSVETASSDSGKQFKQTWKNNMVASGKHNITDSKKDFTKVSFKPDLSKFKMTHLNKDIISLMTRRVYDIAGCTRGVAVYLNGNKLPIKSFKEYVELYVKSQTDDDDSDLPRKVVHEIVNPRWEVCVTPSPNGFQQSSFVNSIATTKGGTHVQHVVDQIVSKVLEVAKKKNKGGMDLKPFHIKGHLWVFINCLIENPSFDSQTKENMTLKPKSFGSQCPLDEKFTKQILGCGIIERILNWAKAKSQSQLNKKQHGSKNTKLKGIPKLDDANNAGSKSSHECTLIVTEGDSAKTLAVSGLGVVGRDNYGVFPLRGKLLNVREASHSQVMNNEEIKNIIKILGLQYSKKYTDNNELKTLRYGHIMIMADQDQDGSHIKGLVINFFHYNWPHLLHHGFIEEFITPIVKVTKGQQELAFFSLPEFESWKAATENAHTWKVKYYKGLGTSTSKEAKEYFSDMDLHRIPFQYAGANDDQAIELAFSKKLANERKEWLTSWLQNRRERRAQGLSESYLYGERTEFVTYSDFINKELILFSNMDNERSIPCMVDGLKPGQRKVLYTCFKRNDKKDIKVAQLAGSVAEHSAYHHGETSLMATIINLAQNFVGSNNVNILQPIGQFGTRLHGGKDAASPRYIFTLLSPLARLLFPLADSSQLNYLYDDNQKIEPEWYCPIIPLVLVNGAEGIGTGYSTNVPNYNPREIVSNLKRIMNGFEPEGMKPWYKNFQGTIAPVEPQKYMMYGRVGILNDTSFEITELPIKTWTQSYKENVLEPMLHGTDKAAPFITDYKEYHTDTTVKFVVTLTAEKMEEARSVGIHKKFKLESSINTSNMVLFDADGCLRKYHGEIDILKDFYNTRISVYHERKAYLEGKLQAESLRLDNQARFIMENVEGKIVIGRKKIAQVTKELLDRGYDSDPVKAWKNSLSNNLGDDQDDEETANYGNGGPDFNYLLSMQFWNLTNEKAEELLKNRDKKAEELRILREKTAKDLWNEDLEAFLIALDELEEHERQEESAGAAITVKKKTKGKGRQAKLTAGGSLSKDKSVSVTKPSPFAEIIAPVIPEFCAEKKEPKPRKPKIDPSQTKLKFNEPGTKKDTVDILVVEEARPKKTKMAKDDIVVTEEIKPKKKRLVDDSDDNDDDDFVTDTKTVQSKIKFPSSSQTHESRKRTCKTNIYKFEDSEDTDDDIVVISPPKKAKQPVQQKSKNEEGATEQESKQEQEPSTTKGFAKRSAKETVQSKKLKQVKVPILKKTTAKKPTAAASKTSKEITKKAAIAKKLPKQREEEEEKDSSSDKDMSIIKPVRSKREHKKVKYFSDDEDESESGDEWKHINDSDSEMD